MSEEIKIKISQPLFEIGELETFDNNIHSIVEEYSKMQLHEKEQILTQRIIIKQEEEIERLNNKINELEKWLKEENEGTIFDYHYAIEDVIDKLIELKGSDKE